MVVMSFADLIRLFPEQIFEFIEINVRTKDVIESELDVLRRVHVRSAILIDMVAGSDADGFPDRLLLLAHFKRKRSFPPC